MITVLRQDFTGILLADGGVLECLATQVGFPFLSDVSLVIVKSGSDTLVTTAATRCGFVDM